ncbi:MAG: hypothetical protein ACK4UL_06300 [Novosphingobium meiothermophilum]|uniref:hypothetical protein n=1 Tax=Novosphingobium TaxID=165696 RepID=UPI0011AB8972|nr:MULTISPECIES: hypothetical protein [Novosphingobium]
MTGPSALRPRGQPVIALALVLAAWVAARMMLVEGGAGTGGFRDGPVLALRAQVLAASASLRDVQGRAPPEQVPGGSAIVPSARMDLARMQVRAAGDREAAGDIPAFLPQRGFQSARFAQIINPPLMPARPGQRDGAPALEPRAAPVKMPPADEAAPAKDDPRWSGDNWLLLRRGSGAAAQAPGVAAYGASQAGAIVRYRFGTGQQRESYAYLRTSLAINAPGADKEIALGLGLRPQAALPLRVLAEARLQDTRQRAMEVRPVVTVITELPWQNLPLGLRAEAYGQAGYAAGRDATAFFDAQALVDRPLEGVLPRRQALRIGAGIWTGGQKGAARLDAGPRASVRIDLGDGAPTRLALDWRFRIAGNASPGSGPALTIASSF